MHEVRRELTPPERTANDIAPSLGAFLAAHGGAGEVVNLEPMADGHAGLTFGFELMLAGRQHGSYILKCAPTGAPLRGSTDVYRQAPLLQALSRAGFPAPDVPWASQDASVLGAPFIVMQRLAGRSVIIWAPAPPSLVQFNDRATIWSETAKLMGALHRFDWRDALSNWEEPTNLARELQRWTRLLRHTQDDAMLAKAYWLGARLSVTWPSQNTTALIHGDLQPGNVLFHQGHAHALIDWDLAAIGPTGLDVGWLLMCADAAAWPSDWTPIAPPSRSALLDAYAAAGGEVPDHLDWHEAFALFRMTAITGLNLKLHRDGRRHDPIWERFGCAVPHLLARAIALMA